MIYEIMHFTKKVLYRLGALLRKRDLGMIPKSYIKRFLPKNPVVVDAGAHIGRDTIEMARMWPSGTIHAFEPIPQLYSQLELNTASTKNITCYPMALSDRLGSFPIHVSSGFDDGSSSLLAPREHLTVHPQVEFLETIHVPTTTLDSWAKDNDISRVDFLWLDLQGHELSVLKASPKVLRTVIAIHTEVSLKTMYEGSALYPELRSWLEQKGFEVKREALPWSDMGNVFFVGSSTKL